MAEIEFSVLSRSCLKQRLPQEVAVGVLLLAEEGASTTVPVASSTAISSVNGGT